MSSPLLILIGPLISATLVFVLRRWLHAATIIAVISLIILSLMLAGADLDAPSGQVDGILAGNTWLVLGREVILTDAVRTILLFVYIATAAIFLLTLALPQGGLFITLSLAVLSPLAGAIMVRPFVFGGVLVLVAAGILAVFVQGERAGSTLAALRYISMAALAVPLLLIAGWILETNQMSLFGMATRLYMVAFVILLAGFPFQIWVAPLVTESQTLIPSIVFGLAQIMIVAFCLILLISAPSVQRSAQFWQILRVSGAITLVLAGLLSLTARSFGRLFGYLLLIDIGVIVAVFSLLDRTGPGVVMTLMVFRIIGLVLIGLGYGIIRFRLGPDIGIIDLSSSVQGLAWKIPIGFSLFVYGGLSLVGMPLTPGFRGHWAAVNLTSTQSFLYAAVVVLSIAAGVAALLRLLYKAGRVNVIGIEPERNLTRGMKLASGFVLVVSIIVAIYPQPLIDVAERMADLF